MNCPACDHSLAEVPLGSVSIDICEGGCGGIWFDHSELSKVETEHRNAAESVVKINRKARTQLDTTRPRTCPRCTAAVLEKKIPRLGSAVEFDRCPKCHGYWLDHGALEKLIKENSFYTPAHPGKRIYVSLEIVRFMHTVKIKNASARA
jgi:Zn-finger nucleic acid-binding protein